MRIGIDARMTYYRRAGISQYTLQLIEGLARCDTKDEFVILQSRKSREPILERPNFSTRRLYTPSHHRLEQFTLPLEISHLRLDVLHSPDFIPPFRRNCRSVITVHDLVFLLYPDFLTKDAARYYGQIDQAVRRTDAIIAVSQATKIDVMRLLGVPENKVTVIYEAASPDLSPSEQGRGHRAYTVAFWRGRRFSPLRQHHRAAQECAQPAARLPRLLDNYQPKVKLVLAGEKGWLSDEVFGYVDRLESR